MRAVRGTPPWDPLEWSTAWWDCCARSAEIWWTRSGGRPTIEARSRERFAELVRFARERSAFYRALYRGVSASAVSPGDLPVVTKRQLMTHFDECVTDPAVRLADVQRFLRDRTHIGQPFLDRYLVWKSSGSSGVPGIFLQDAEAMARYDALVLAHADVSKWSAEYTARIVAGNARAALIVATDDHFASIASFRRTQRLHPALQAQSFSVLEPLPRLVEQLNAYRPAFVASYPTVLCLLAEEQRAGRLQIAPASLWSGGECLAHGAHAAIEQVFGCPLVNEYGASECLSIGYECKAGWLHVNADWVILEAVDQNYQPVAPGEASCTSLLTNLASRVQPIIRYDLGDSITVNPDPCSCGNPLPGIHVQGRRDEVLSLRARDGRDVRLLPMALTTVVEDATELHRFQLVQTDARTIALRFEQAHDTVDRRRGSEAAASALRDYLRANALEDVDVVLDGLPAQIQSPGGKLRVVACHDTGITH